MASGPITHDKYKGEKWKQRQIFFWGAPKSLRTVTAAMKLKDVCSLEEKLWQITLPLKKLLLASDWALIDTKQLTIDHTVILRPQVTIIQWVQSSPKTHRTGQAQESSIIKWKWYIQDQAKPGPHEFTALHKRISENLTKGLKQQALIKPKITKLLVKWWMPFDCARKTACVV